MKSKIDANAVAARCGIDGLGTALASEEAKAADLKAKHSSGHDPEIKSLRRLLDKPPPEPEQLIEGVLYRGGKGNLSGNSKGRKTWVQLHLGACIATGTDWFGHKVKRGRVQYWNLELQEFSLYKRVAAIEKALGVEIQEGSLDYLQLRGHRMTLEALCSFAERRIERGAYDLILVDPLYKLLGKRSENDASDVADLLQYLESIAHDAGAALLITHHFAKGSAGQKDAIDRSSGSGVLARDGDVIMTLTPHEEHEAVTLEAIVRDFAPVEPMALRWNYPLFIHDPDLVPCKHQKPGAQRKVTAADVRAVIASKPLTYSELTQALEARCDISKRTAERAIKTACADKQIRSVQGAYMLPEGGAL